MMRISGLFIILIFLIWPTTFSHSSTPNRGPFKFGGDGSIAIFNTHLSELETVKYRDGGGKYINSGLERLNWVLRCRLTNEPADMSIELIELVDFIEDHFGAKEVDVISGYRSPKLNSTLKRTGHKVASNSLHLYGMAMDIRLPNVPLVKIRDLAKRLGVGGVGFYPGQFVHVDVGEVRYW